MYVQFEEKEFLISILSSRGEKVGLELQERSSMRRKRRNVVSRLS